MASHPSKAPAALAARTNTDLNLSVLKRYLPSITSILSIAANAVVYIFQPPTEWKKSNLEGTMFICAQAGQDGAVRQDACLFVLNRKGLQNFVLDLSTVSDFELSDDLLIFKLEHKAGSIPMENGEIVVDPLVVGLWTYAEDEDDRKTNAALIHEMWTKMRAAREQRAMAGISEAAQTKNTEGPAMQAMGRKLSLAELFGTHNGTSAA